jgi:Tol biopolymer transport system component
VHDRQIEAHDRRIEALRNAGGSNPRNISHHPADDLYPAWSRDGYKIGFASASDRDGNLEIYPILAPR